VSTYLIVDLATIALPLLLSFDRRVSFYKRWPAVFPAVGVVGVLYLAWDVLVTTRGDWSFNPAHFGSRTVLGLPIEELLFFVAVPYACLFIFEVVQAYLPERTLPLPRVAWLALAAAAVAGAIVTRERDYTFLVLLSVALFFLLGCLFFPDLLRSLHFWLFIVITYIPFLVVNGVLTGLPVVIYNPQEILGIRAWSIPIEDFFYSLSLLGLCGMAYTVFRRRVHRGRSR
jgi:lycopene cyclase domain-containing protein